MRWIALVVTLTMAVVFTGPVAHAQVPPPPQPPAVTVTPNTGLVDRQAVEVTASGFPADPDWDAVVVAQCHANATDWLGCGDYTNVYVSTPEGSATTSYAVARILTTNAFGTVDCAVERGRCVIAVAHLETGLLATAPLAFDATERPASTSPPGWLDRGFGTGGAITVDVTGEGLSDTATAVAVQPDGKVVVAGEATDAEGRISVVVLRYRGDGAPDERFGRGGRVVVAPPEAAGPGHARDLVIQPDRKLVVSGSFGLARFRPDGRLDRSFGEGGWAMRPEPFIEITDIALHRDGRLAVTGGMAAAADFGLARYRADGTLDPSFGTGGVVTTDFDGGFDGALALVVRPGGRTVAAGYTEASFALAGYRLDGTLDPAFGAGGRVVTDVNVDYEAIRALALGPRGALIAAGTSYRSGGGDIAVARYRGDGALDPAFGEDGLAIVHTTPDGRGADEVSEVVVQADGRPVVAGSWTGVPWADFVLTRLRADGTPDPTFGRNGTVTTDIGGGLDFAVALTVQRDGKLVAAGGTRTSSAPDVAVARYHPTVR